MVGKVTLSHKDVIYLFLESDKSDASAVSALDQLEDIKKPAKQPIYNSLLHRKLRMYFK